MGPHPAGPGAGITHPVGVCMVPILSIRLFSALGEIQAWSLGILTQYRGLLGRGCGSGGLLDAWAYTHVQTHACTRVSV